MLLSAVVGPVVDDDNVLLVVVLLLLLSLTTTSVVFVVPSTVGVVVFFLPRLVDRVRTSRKGDLIPTTTGPPPITLPGGSGDLVVVRVL